MKQKYLVLILLIPLSTCFKVPKELQNICPQGCKKYYKCDAIQKKCVFKGFFPIYPIELFEVFVLGASSAIANSCGIGGGTVYSSFIIGIQEFEPSQAFPTANCLILSCGLVTFFSRVFDKIQNPSNQFVDYEIASILGPAIILGAKIGAIINKILSSFSLLIIATGFLGYSISKTSKNYKKKKKEEEAEEYLRTERSKEITKPLLTDIIQQDYEDVIILNKKDLELLKEDQKPFRFDRLLFIIGVEVLLIIDLLLEGNVKLPSIIGIKRCGVAYWIIFGLHALASFLLIRVAFHLVQKHTENKKRIDQAYNDEKFRVVMNRSVEVVLTAIGAGVVSTTTGTGGGMVMKPLFISLGLLQEETSATSNFLIVIGGIAGTFMFAAAGQLELTFTFWMLIPCTLCAFLGSFFILKYINESKKSSIFHLIMLYFLVASFLILIVKEYFSFSSDSLRQLITFNSYCS